MSAATNGAGADPGPACYGRGGVAPTVTDADLVLGYLDPSFFLGGKLPLHREAAERSIRQAVAGPLGMEVAEAAWLESSGARMPRPLESAPMSLFMISR